MSEGGEREIMLDVRQLGFLTAQELAARRQVEEQLAHFHAGALGAARGFHFHNAAAVNDDLGSFGAGVRKFVIPDADQRIDGAPDHRMEARAFVVFRQQTWKDRALGRPAGRAEQDGKNLRLLVAGIAGALLKLAGLRIAMRRSQRFMEAFKFGFGRWQQFSNDVQPGLDRRRI